MKPSFFIKTHFLGSKIKHLRKSNKMTLEDLSIRCYQIDSSSAPSVSYLSLIESGQRSPSEKLLNSICIVFQKQKDWFYDQNLVENINIDSSDNNISSFQLEPNFLFSKDILEKTIPRLLSQTSTSGRQFANILIRSYQEKNKNQFNYIEKEAEMIGSKKFPLSIDDILNLYKKHNLRIKWFKKEPFITKHDTGQQIRSLFRSFYNQENKTIYINSKMENEISRIKYDLSTYLAHKVLHGGDGIVSSHASGGELGGSPKPFEKLSKSFEQKDVLYAWRDFECSFFAGALLCPKMPFRKAMNKVQYDILKYREFGLTPAVLMRRLTAISPYKKWHYFDAYPPGYLRTMYRGSDIPIPWGNSKLISNPCKKWGIFKHLNNLTIKKPISHLSILKENNNIFLYCSVTLKTNDAAGNPHVVCAGINLNDALDMQEYNKNEILEEIYKQCYEFEGSKELNKRQKKIILQIGMILNISWIIESINNPVDIICHTSADCPACEKQTKQMKKISWTNQVRKEILKKNL
tara:strand:- start:98 stop:1657 length:1560 start_codon:yes stop_codon:yes gene_type:complete